MILLHRHVATCLHNVCMVARCGLFQLAVIPTEPCTFLSCGQDGTLRCFDLRVKTSCSRNNCKEVSAHETACVKSFFA